MAKDNQKEEVPVAIGINLGTTSPCVAMWSEGRQRAEIIIGSKHGNPKTPTNIIPDQTKSRGRTGSRGSHSANGADSYPFKVVGASNSRHTVPIPSQGIHTEFTGEEISTRIMEMKSIIEEQLKQRMNAVVVVPAAYLDEVQRCATKNVCPITGLNVVEVVDELSAVAWSHSFRGNNHTAAPKNVLALSLGAEALDVAVFEIQCRCPPAPRARLTTTGLGEDHLTDALMNVVVDEFCTIHGRDYTDTWTSVKSNPNLRNSCEKAKRELFSKDKAKVIVAPLIDSVTFETSVSRRDFEDASKKLFEKCLAPVEQCLTEANISKSDIHDVLLVGGFTEIPIIRQLFKDCFKRETPYIDVDEAAACGAAILAAAKLEEISIKSMSIKRSRSVSAHPVDKMQQKEQFDTSTPEPIGSELKRRGKEEGTIRGMEDVKGEVNEAHGFSKKNMLKRKADVRRNRKKKSDHLLQLKKILPMLWEILKVALQFAGVLLPIMLP